MQVLYCKGVLERQVPCRVFCASTAVCRINSIVWVLHGCFALTSYPLWFHEHEQRCMISALMNVVNDLLHSLDQGNVSLLTLLDLSAAFDTIYHTILRQLLEHVFGIRSIALHWFSSYLSNRNQTVIAQNCSSAPVSVCCGVPQGSVLGPYSLCSVYRTHLRSQQLNELIQSTQECIQDVKSWMTHSKFKLDDDKTEALNISAHEISNSTSYPDSLVVGNSIFLFSESVKKPWCNVWHALDYGCTCS